MVMNQQSNLIFNKFIIIQKIQQGYLQSDDIDITSSSVLQSLLRKQLFDDANFAWEVLQTQVKIETSTEVSSEDVSHLLELYMVLSYLQQKGVEKMNSYLDFRQSYFKDKVMTLMSRPSVMKTLNNKNVMGKKSTPAQAATTKQQNSPNQSPKSSDKSNSIGSGKKIESKAELRQLKQKKRQIQVRLAYESQSSSPQMLQKMAKQQNQKQTKIVDKITKIVQNHEQKLARRIKQRKLRTTAAKSLSNILINHSNESGSNMKIPYVKTQKQKYQQAFGSCILLQQDSNQKKDTKQKVRRAYRSLEPKRTKNMIKSQGESPLRRSISFGIAIHINNSGKKQSQADRQGEGNMIKIWDFSKNQN